MHRPTSSHRPTRPAPAARALLVTALVTALGVALAGGATAAAGAATPAGLPATSGASAPATSPHTPPAHPGPPAAPGPVPAMTGPLPVTAESHPFGAADRTEVPEDLASSGYVEEEFLASGSADVYSWPADAPAVVRTPDAPYTTRVLVRRPADGEHFSGSIVVEMLNPSNLFDLNIGWALAREEIIDSGDAWVGITAKPVAIEALKTFDPQRYAALSFANPLPLDDPANCAEVAADSDRATENGLVWDAYTQVGNWLRSGDAANPLTYGGPATRVEHAYGFGYSQTGGYLVNYAKAVHPLVVAEQGAPVYDGYLVGVAGGAFAGAYPMNQCEPAPPPEDPRRRISGIGVPVVQMMSQSDYLRGITARRPDSDTAPDQFRYYEMAGAGHATPEELAHSASSADIVRAGRAVPPAACDQGPRSRFPSSIFFNNALDDLDRWVREGIAPPRADPIVVRDGAPVLDEVGNVLGGLRSPYLDVPTSTWFGTATGASFCFIAGYEVPLEPAVLRELYDGREDYVRRVTQDVVALEEAGFLTAYDADQLIEEARGVELP